MPISKNASNYRFPQTVPFGFQTFSYYTHSANLLIFHNIKNHYKSSEKSKVFLYPGSMHDTRNNRVKFWIVLGLLLITFLLLGFSLNSGSSNESKRLKNLNVKLQTECERKKDKNDCVDVYIQLLNFDSEKQILQGRIFFYIPEVYADQYDSSVQVFKTTDIYLDAARLDVGQQNSNLFYEPGDFIRGIDFTLDVTNRDYARCTNDSCYPYDKFSAVIEGSVRVLVDEGIKKTVQDDKWSYLPVIINEYTSVIPNWIIEYDYDYIRSPSFKSTENVLDYQSKGAFQTVFRFERAPQSQMIVILLGLIFLGGAISMLLLLRSVLFSHKKPTLAALAWAGTTAFTMIQTRSLLPGNPRLGIMFDVFIFYPSLTTCFVCGLAMLRRWLKDEQVMREV
jgi:hypothetical protein